MKEVSSLKGAKKDIVVLFVIFIAVVILIKGTEFQTVDEYYLTHIDDISENSKTVTFSINCEKALEKSEFLNDRQRKLIGDGIILEPTEYVLRDGDTVFDMLSRVTRYNKIQMEYQGSDQNIYNSVYIQGINYLYEFDCGETAGWIYLVNGQQPENSCGNYKLSDGDVVEWVYSLELGQDVGG